MAQNNLSTIAQSEQGAISLKPEMQCEACGNKGVYEGSMLEIDDLCDTVGQFCPKCSKTTTTRWSLDTAEGKEKILIMKARFVRWPELLEIMSKQLPGEHCVCPDCKHGFVVKDTSENGGGDADRYWEVSWHICPNPTCKNPGHFLTEGHSYMYG